MTPHISASKDQIASKILLPGDPLRAKYIAENFLDGIQQFNAVRNMFGYSGSYKGEAVSVMGTGMGIPSMSIYVSELINDFGVEQLIRVGSCGAYSDKLNLRDLVLAQSASTDSNITSQLDLKGNISTTPSFDLLNKAYMKAKDLNLSVCVGDILTSDIFYDFDKHVWKKWAKLGILGVEMETFVLYLLAKIYDVQALSILTVSDSIRTGEELSPSERERNFNEMIELALETIID